MTEIAAKDEAGSGSHPSPGAGLLERYGLAGSGHPPATRFRRLSSLICDVAELGGPEQLAVRCGTVLSVKQNTLIVDGISRWSNLGDLLRVGSGSGREWYAQVIAANPDTVIAKPMSTTIRVKVGDQVELHGPVRLHPSAGWKGRILDAFGNPLDGKGPIAPGEQPFDPYSLPPDAMRRERIVQRAVTGVHAIDLFIPICHGQRIGIFGGSGTGKSSLLSLLANTKGFDTIVIGLIGERGREVREFVEDKLGSGHANATVIASTGDEAPSVRMLAANTAMLAAEYFRDRGDRVLLIIDSVTRFAHAVREVGLAAGEMPVVRGHTTLLYSSLSQLLERAGPSSGRGMITGIFSVLVDGDDHNEPVADAVRGILDGHIVLDRSIAATGRFPAINIPMSLSRLSDVALKAEQRELVRQARRLIATFEQADEMRKLGGYVEGADAYVDLSLKLVPQIYEYMTQDVQSQERAGYDPFARLSALLAKSTQPEIAARPAEARNDPAPPARPST